MEKAVIFRTIMNEPYRDHPSEDALERFLFNQSGDEELEIVESHFLACEACVTRLESLELDIAAKKMAMRDLLAEQVAITASKAAVKQRNLFGWFTLPQVSFAGAAMAACAIAISFVSVPREINLVAERGNDNGTNIVSRWRPLHLHLQESELKAGPVTVEVVDATGKQIWHGGAIVKNEEIEVNAPRLLNSGDFLLRVYSPATNQEPGDLVREYKLQAGSGF